MVAKQRKGWWGQSVDSQSGKNQQTQPYAVPASTSTDNYFQICHFGNEISIAAVTNWLTMSMMLCLLLCIPDCWDDTREKGQHCCSFQIICPEEVFPGCNICVVSCSSSILWKLCSWVRNKWKLLKNMHPIMHFTIQHNILSTSWCWIFGFLHQVFTATVQVKHRI